MEEFRQKLPIYQFKENIIQIIKDNIFCIITGDTGSGKSTQLPQYILDSKEILEQQKHLQELYDKKHKINSSQEINKLKIVITQPRRVAAISMAKRICEERMVELGEEVGYTIRFDDKTSSYTHLRYMTDGILVRECLQDPLLLKYNVVILDEAHERSLFTDILFALIKKAAKNREGSLRLIITSATLNTTQFSKFFDNCPVLKMKGNSYPVEIKYGPCLANKRIEESVKAVIRMHLHEGPGDILVFLTGSEECEKARKVCNEKLEELLMKGREIPAMMIFALYGSLQQEEQQQIFQPAPPEVRKVIFSTNIAETSLTIDNIGFVIDCGFVKQKCYNPRTGMDALIVVPISKVQAIQRTGRAGRTQEGKCYRLYSSKFYEEEMKNNTVPEILRVSLTNVILTLKSMNIHDVMNFDYMEHPSKEAILQALRQLRFLSAIDDDGSVTQLGLEMNKFPLEPSYSKALITSHFMNCIDEVIRVVAILSSEQIWSKPSRVKEEEYKNYEYVIKKYMDVESGDHRGLLNIIHDYLRGRQVQYINIRAAKQSENIELQLKDIIKQVSFEKCKTFYEKEHVYQIYLEGIKTYQQSQDIINNNNNKKHNKYQEKVQYKNSKYQSIFTKDEIFRMALTSGFYYNSARKIQNVQDGSYLLQYPEGNIVDIDSFSVFAINEQYPPHVIFTELGGTNSIRGVMRLVSKIDPSWVKPYIQLIQSIDSERLAGIKKVENKPIILTEEEKKVQQEQLQQKREEKLNEAKKRYLERKNQK